MDENEWGYHGEGNKSLVVAHAQVSDRRAARLRASPTALAALCLLPSSSGRDSSSSFRSGGSLVPPSQYPQLRAPPGTAPLSPLAPFPPSVPSRLSVPPVLFPTPCGCRVASRCAASAGMLILLPGHGGPEAETGSGLGQH